MTIKSVLVPVGDIAHDGGAVEAALGLAELFRGHVDCLFVTGDVSDMVPPGAMGLFESIHSQMADEFAEDRERQRALAHGRFTEMLSERGIGDRGGEPPAGLPSASWEVGRGSAAGLVAARGGAYDLIVVGPARPDQTTVGEISAEAALFGTGRPVMVVPPGEPGSVGGSVVIGWNRTPSAARAVAAALPFLASSRSVTVVSVTTGAKQGPSPQGIARYLSWHGVSAEVVEIPPDHRVVGEALLDEASERGADLVVMGAYSHSRLRELILGGVTRYVLQHPKVPVLMAH